MGHPPLKNYRIDLPPINVKAMSLYLVIYFHLDKQDISLFITIFTASMANHRKEFSINKNL